MGERRDRLIRVTFGYMTSQRYRPQHRRAERLRRKLQRYSNAPRVIQTERAVGYVSAVPVERV
jgi:DNA-binding response OmpR family regulator